MTNVLVLDTETLLFSAQNMAPTVVCGSWAARDQGQVQSGLVHNRQGLEFFRELFLDALEYRITLVGHNIAYDMACIANTWPELFPLIWELYDNELVSDTIVRQKLSDLARGRYRGFTTEKGVFIPLKYDLASVYHRHTKRDLAKEDTWRLRYGELLEVPLELWPEDAKTYPVDDALATLAVYEAQAEDAAIYPEGQWFFVNEHAQCRAAWWLHLTSVRGIYTAPDALEKLKVSAQAEIDLLEEGLVEAGLVEITYQRHRDKSVTRKATSKQKATKQYVWNAYREQGRVPRLTDKGEEYLKTQHGGDLESAINDTKLVEFVCTDRDSCLETGDPVLETYVSYKSALKTLNSDIKAYEQGVEFPLHTRFESLAATGRTTSSAPNIQNVRWNFPERCTVCRSRKCGPGHICQDCGGKTEYPPGIRECFIPRPGHVILAADYDGLELRTLAQCCLSLVGESRLAGILNAGGDPHMAVASQILGLPLDYCLEHKKDDRIQLARQTGKVANFGFPGGLGAKTFVLFARMNYGVRLTEDEAGKLKKTWIETFPEFRRYFKYINTLEQPDETYAVEHLISRRLRSGCFYPVACNSPFQGLGADATKAAGYLISRACYYDRESPLFGCGIINYIHDEFLVEVPVDSDGRYTRANKAAAELVHLMQVGAAPYLPDVPATATPLLMARWSKRAKPIKDVDGLLVPWDG